MSVPYHLREDVFRRNEDVIHKLLLQYPNPLTIDPSPYSLLTFSCRLRDAINSVITYNWPTAVDVQMLAKVWPKLVVRIKDGLVVVEPRSPAQSVPLQPPAQPLEPQVVHKPIENPDLVTLYSLAQLMILKLIPRPVVLKNVNKTFLDEVGDKYDVAFREEDDGTIIML